MNFLIFRKFFGRFLNFFEFILDLFGFIWIFKIKIIIFLWGADMQLMWRGESSRGNVCTCHVASYVCACVHVCMCVCAHVCVISGLRILFKI